MQAGDEPPSAGGIRAHMVPRHMLETRHGHWPQRPCGRPEEEIEMDI